MVYALRKTFFHDCDHFVRLPTLPYTLLHSLHSCTHQMRMYEVVCVCLCEIFVVTAALQGCRMVKLRLKVFVCVCVCVYVSLCLSVRLSVYSCGCKRLLETRLFISKTLN